MATVTGGRVLILSFRCICMQIFHKFNNNKNSFSKALLITIFHNTTYLYFRSHFYFLQVKQLQTISKKICRCIILEHLSMLNQPSNTASATKVSSHFASIYVTATF